MVSSCLGDGEMGQTYTLSAGFQYSDMGFYPDSTFFNTTQPEGFGYDALNFFHELDPGKLRVDGGFIISRQEMPLSGNTEGLSNTYRCYLKETGNYAGNIYTVWYQNPDASLMPEHAVQFPLTENGTCTPLGCFVTNTVEVADAIKANFADGDRLVLTAKGFLDGKPAGQKSINLADFSVAKDSIVSKWTPFELDSFGPIDYVDFEVESTNPNVPAYFCMDNFTAYIEITY